MSISRFSRDDLLLLALLALHLLSIWSFQYFPSQDGPAHIENATILKEYHNPNYTVFREFYTINTNPEPNWFGHIALIGLTYLVPALIAEKILLSGYIILFLVSVRYALRAINPAAIYLALLAVPFVGNLFFHLGFYNYSYSLPLFFFVVGYWLKHCEHFNWRAMLTLAILSLILYFCHLVSLLSAALAIGIQIAWLGFFDLRQPQQREAIGQALWRVFLARCLLPMLAFVPSLVLAVFFLQRQGVASTVNVIPINLWKYFFTLEALVSYSDMERLIGLAFAAFFALFVGWVFLVRLRRRQLQFGDGLAIATGVNLLVYFLAPQAMAGGLFVNQRLSLYPFFTAILWLATQPLNSLIIRVIRVAGIAVSLLFLFLHAAKYAELNGYLREYTSVSVYIEPNKTLLPLSWAHGGRGPDGRQLSNPVAPFRHAAGYIAAERRIVELANYEANVGYFPLRFRPEVDPYTFISLDRSNPDQGLEGIPPHVDFLNYEKKTNKRVDYVLLWCAPENPTDELTKSVFDQLRKGGYEHIRIPTSYSPPLVQLYRAKQESKPEGK